MSYTFCDGISKLIPNKPGWPSPCNCRHLTKRRMTSTGLRHGGRANSGRARGQRRRRASTLLEMARKLEGMTRNIGMHAGGVLIAPGKLTDFCPLYQQPGSESAVSQYDKNDVEAVGLVKFDFLGLATLTILEIAREFIIKRHQGQENFALREPAAGRQSDLQAVLRTARPKRCSSLNPAACRACARCQTDATGRPDCAQRLVPPRPDGPDSQLCGAQTRARRGGVPTPAGGRNAVRDLRHHGLPGAGDADRTDSWAATRLGGADMLRRAMGKKDADEMAEHRQIFRDGAARTTSRRTKRTKSLT
jgi:DNA polymerase-3 subunit alpha